MKDFFIIGRKAGTHMHVSACVQVYFTHEGDAVNSCTLVSAERKKLPGKRMKGNTARVKKEEV